MKMFVFGLVVAVAFASMFDRSAVAAGTMTLRLRSTATLPTSTVDQNDQNFTVGGLSGITHLGGASYAAVMDNSNKLVLLDIEFGTDGAIVSSRMRSGLSLTETRDFEGIACSGPARNSVYLSEEGTPGIHEYRLSDGVKLNSPAVPAVFQNRVPNQGFESLTIESLTIESGSVESGAAAIWTGNEQALTVDGPLAQDSGTTVRLLRYQATLPPTSAR